MFRSLRALGVMLVVLAGVGAAPAQPAAPKEALDGIDPVILLSQGKEVSGKSDLAVVRGKFRYLFATAENKAAFEQAPSRYEIQLDGMCARMGGGVTGNPADYAVVDGKIYVFGSDDCHKRFVSAPAKYLPKAPAPMPTAAAAFEQGRLLIDRAVEAIGGAQPLDAVTTYVESSSQVQKRPTGDVPVSLKTMWKFPGGVRAERTITTPDRTMTSANLVTPEGGWFIGQGRAYQQSPEGRASTARDYSRQLVPLLRARHDAGFRAAAIGSTMIDGVAVERVRVLHDLVDVTLTIEKASGAVHSIAFTGRNMDSEIGDYMLLLGDYRNAGGLRLPFAERALFNGAPDAFLTRTIDMIAINTPLDPALFTPAAGGGQ